MGAYITIEKNIGDMLRELTGSEIISKLLSNSTKAALDDGLPVGFNGLTLLNDKIFDIPKALNPETDMGSFILCHLIDSKMTNGNNINQYNMYVNMAVITHDASWDLGRGRKRPYRLLDEIENVIKGKETESIRGKWQIYSPFKYARLNDSYSVFISQWVVTNPSKSC